MGKTNAVDLLELLPTSLLDSLSVETGVDYKVHKLRGRLMFNLLLYGMLEEDRLSLRTLEDCFRSSKFKFFFHLPPEETTSHTSLSDRLACMKVSYFAQLYAASHEIFSKHFDEPTILKYHLRRVDSTMVCEQARKLAEGMSVGRKKDGKKQIKISLSLTNLFPSSFELFTSQSALSEEVALPIELFKSNLAKENNNVIAVFDRGIAQQKVYTELTNESRFFVTRIKQNTNYDTLREIPDNIDRSYQSLTLVAEREIRLKKSR